MLEHFLPRCILDLYENRIARRILNDLDTNVVPKVRENGQIVTEFVQKLQSEFDSFIELCGTNISPLKGTSFINSGSAYEGLAVSEDADFDIIVVPGKPYVAENFVAHREPNRLFTLEWKSQVNNKLVDIEGYLDTAGLRLRLFSELNHCVKRVQLPNAKINCTIGIAALLVEIVLDAGHTISIDLVPQIAFHSWDQCPDLKPLDEMPFALRIHVFLDFIHASPTMFFNLAVPGRHEDRRLCNVSFALLEKKFVTSDTGVRDMVRLVKFVAHRCDWKKKYGFQSYFAKRVALKHYGTLKYMDLWNGYLTILRCLWQEFQSGTVDGYFIRNQVTYFRNQDYASNLRMEIKTTLTKSASEIEYMLGRRDYSSDDHAKTRILLYVFVIIVLFLYSVLAGK